MRSTKWTRPRGFGLGFLVTALSLCVASESFAVLAYRETFPNQSGGATQPILAGDQGWYGTQSGSNVVGQVDRGSISAGSPGSAELLPINANPVGPTSPNTSFVFWSPGNRSNVFLYTLEFSIPSTSIAQVSWESRNNEGSTTGLTEVQEGRTDQHLAFRVDGDVYVSDQGFLHQGDSNAWSPNSVDVSTLTFGLFDQFETGDTSFMPRRTTDVSQQSGLSLPSGTVDFFGLYTAQNLGTIRFDNFTVSAIPEPSLFVVWGAAAGLVLLRRKAERRP
ncbi:MAG: hypothetical protein AAGJ46_19495 [Planctomycetota bacterium]